MHHVDIYGQIEAFVRDAAWEIMTHEREPDGYVSYIITYNELAFKAICLESAESDWVASRAEAEDWIKGVGVW